MILDSWQIRFMKRYAAIIVALLVWICSMAQIDKGTTQYGGSAGFQFRKTAKTTTDLTFSFSPGALYSVHKNIAIGGQLSYIFNHYRFKDASSDFVENRHAFSIGPALRANFGIGEKSVAFFHTATEFGLDVERDPRDKNKLYQSSSIVLWKAGPGVCIFVNKNVALEFSFYYESQRTLLNIKQQQTVAVKGTPEFTHGVSFSIGIRFFTQHRKRTVNAPSEKL